MWGSDCQPAACCCCFSFLPFTGDDTPSELHHPLSSCCFRPALKGREKKNTFTNIYLCSNLHLDTYKKKESTKPGTMWGKGPIMHDNADGHKFSVPSENSAHQIPPTTICSPYTSLHGFCQTIWSNHVQTHTTHTLAPVCGLRKSFYKEKTEVLESTKQKPVQQQREIKPLKGNQFLREKQQNWVIGQRENVIPPR